MRTLARAGNARRLCWTAGLTGRVSSGWRPGDMPRPRCVARPATRSALPGPGARPPAGPAAGRGAGLSARPGACACSIACVLVSSWPVARAWRPRAIDVSPRSAMTGFSHHSGRRAARAQYPHNSARAARRTSSPVTSGSTAAGGRPRTAKPCRTSSARVTPDRLRWTSEPWVHVGCSAPRSARLPASTYAQPRSSPWQPLVQVAVQAGQDLLPCRTNRAPCQGNQIKITDTGNVIPGREGTGDQQIAHPAKVAQALGKVTDGRRHVGHPASLRRRRGPGEKPPVQGRTQAPQSTGSATRS